MICMTQVPHYFIAIPIPITIKTTFANWQTEFKELLPYKQWTNKHDLHITLKFFGPVDGKKILELKDGLRRIEDLQKFSIQAGEIGFFGKQGNPRVLFVRVMLQQNLSRLQQKIDEISTTHEFKPENRAYHPHITL